MRLLLLSAHLPPAIDGVGDYSAYLAAALYRQGVQVTLGCGRQERYTPPLGVDLWPGALEQARTRAGQWIEDLRARRCDWLVLQYVPYAFGRRGLPFFLFSLLAKVRRAGIRVAIFFHEVHIRPEENRLLSVGQQWIARRLCRQADRVFTSIPYYQQMLAALGAQAEILPVGANMECTRPTSQERARMRAQYFPGKRFIVGTFGRRPLRAVSEAIAALPDTAFLIVGASTVSTLPCPMYSTGYLPATDLCRWLCCSDVFVLPDPVTSEGKGGTSLKSGSLAAAFAAALPVIGVRGDLTAPPLAHGENLWLLDDAGRAGWQTALSHLRRHTTLTEHLAQGGYRLYRQHLQWEVLAKNFLRALFD